MKFYIECIFLGFIAALGALFLEFAGPEIIRLFFMNNAYKIDSASMSPSLIAVFALLEELLKLVVIKKRVALLTSGKKLIWGSMAVGIGFALTEIFFIFSGFDPQSSKEYVKIAGIFFFHILSAGFIGSLLHVSNKNIPLLSIGLIAVSLFHFLYNISALLHGIWPSIVSALILIFLGLINSLALMRSSKTLA